MHNMMYGGGYGMMGGGVVGVITLILVWALLAMTIVALWTWIQKNR